MQQEAVRRVREMQARAQHLRPEPAQRREPPEPEPSHQHGERSHERREQPSMRRCRLDLLSRRQKAFSNP